MNRFASDLLVNVCELTVTELMRTQKDPKTDALQSVYQNIDMNNLMAAFMRIESKEDSQLALKNINTRLKNNSVTIANMAFYFHHKIGDNQKI